MHYWCIQLGAPPLLPTAPLHALIYGALSQDRSLGGDLETYGQGSVYHELSLIHILSVRSSVHHEGSSMHHLYTQLGASCLRSNAPH